MYDADGQVTTRRDGCSAPGGSVLAMPIGTCESCGSEEDVTEVRRVYVTPEAWDTEGKAEPQPGTERWCYACRAHYPHQEV